MRLEKRADTIEAVEFKGGTESAREVAEFVRVRNPKAVVLWQVPVKNGVRVEVEELIRIEARTGAGTDISVLWPENWLVIDDHRFYQMSHEALLAQYKEVQDADA